MKPIARAKLILKSAGNGILGILSEVAFVYFFIFAGFVVCLLWWGIFR